MTKFLITGGAGFIGSNFIHYLLEKHNDAFVVNLDKLTYAGNIKNLADLETKSNYLFVKGDICDKKLVEELFIKYNFDCVVNFAAESHVDRSILTPDLFVITNVLGTVNLLNIAKEHWYNKETREWDIGKKFLQISTDEVYGALGKEGFFTEESKIDPHSPYSSSKASADHFVKAFYDTYSMPCVISRCSNNYGPYQFPEKFIPLLINNCINHKSLPIYGDGYQIRDWLYVKDHCKALLMILEKGKNGEVYNIGGHNEKTNLSIVETVIGILSDRLKDKEISLNLITHVEDRLGHDRRYAIDSSKIQNELGWKSDYLFDKAIEITVDWYLKNQVWLDEINNGSYKDYYLKMYESKV